MSLPPRPEGLPGSFRDCDGFVFRSNGLYYRQVNCSYRETYDELVKTGLYERLWRQKLLISHQEINQPQEADGYRTLFPEQLPVIVYPFEWSFGQLKDAALLTLAIEQESLAAGFSLKDASAYNVQYLRGRPIFIDTLSFERYREGEPWRAYRQFCQHFLAPLALMARVDPRLGLLLRNHIDGIPLDLASRLLGWGSRFRLGLLLHVHLHARVQRRFQNKQRRVQNRPISKQGRLGILTHLESTIRGMEWRPKGTEWADYYANTNYADPARADKRAAVDGWIEELQPRQVWDLGANDGTFSRLASRRGIPTVAWDIDPAAVEIGYRRAKKEKDRSLFPAVLDLTNPSPALGWNLTERCSLFDRPKPDLVLALALIHHLAIGNNVPLERCAAFFARVAPSVIIEWVPKEDSKVQELLLNREDIFTGYTRDKFESAFSRYYKRMRVRECSGSHRLLYCFDEHPEQ